MLLNIGEVARQSGLTVEALRYYERQRLIDAATRDSNGYRRYTSEALARIRFIKRAQEVGFSLGEIKDLLSLRTDTDASCHDVRDRAKAKILAVDDKIAILQAMRSALATWVDQCPSHAPVSACPIIEALDGKE